jgi:KDO2-lipid IV(A) lauroyltransferase
MILRGPLLGNLSEPKSLCLKLGLLLVWVMSLPLAWLPPCLGLALGAVGGKLFFYLAARRRRVAVANIKMIQAGGFLPPELSAEATACASFANLGRSCWEIIRCGHRGVSPFLCDCQVEAGQEYMEEILAESRREGRGVVILTGHMGNWEIMCHYTALFFGFKLTIVGRDLRQKLPAALARRLRSVNGDRFLGKDGLARAMVSVLKAGGVLGTLIDQAVIVPTSGVSSLPFMGRTATFNLGPLRLARRAGAPIILVLFRREGRRHYETIFPPLKPRLDLSEEEAYLADAAQINHWLEEFIRRYPDQWLWAHRRWKTRAGVARDPKSLI